MNIESILVPGRAFGSLRASSKKRAIEFAAEKIAETILAEFDMPWIDVRVNKPGAIRGARDVGVHIRRHR